MGIGFRVSLGQTGGDAIELYRRLRGLDFRDAAGELAGMYDVADPW